jgi:adenine deaminase
MMVKTYRTPEELDRHISASMGETSPDLIIKNGNLVNVVSGEIYLADIAIKDDFIVRVGDVSDILSKFEPIIINAEGLYISPGLIDTHLHTESTLLPPTQFTELALPRGTTSVVVDPHEIGNVLGLKGLELYVSEATNLPLEFMVEIPSCVPAAPGLETAGNIITSEEMDPLLNDERYFALAEMMNFPGVIYRDPEVLKKLSNTEKSGRIREGHSPGLQGKELQAYLTSGISSCHESFMVDEVIEKLRLGMAIQLREGSFAKNLILLGKGIKKIKKALTKWNNVIIASDDRHADDLLDYGHLDHSLRLLVNEVGLDPITAIQISTINPARHLLRPDLGQIAPGRKANLFTFKSLKEFEVKDVISKGKHVAHNGALLNELKYQSYPEWALKTIKPKYIPEISDFFISGPIEEGVVKAHVIGGLEHSLITDHLIEKVKIEDSKVVLEDNRDLTYYFLLDRYGNTDHFSKALVSGFNFQYNGAFASTVAHDSHQLLIVGNNADLMYQAMQTVIKSNGGLAVVREQDSKTIMNSLPLPYAGLMSIDPPKQVANRFKTLKRDSELLTAGISEPFMALSFMALPVIPKLKLTDKGLVDVEKFQLIELFEPVST